MASYTSDDETLQIDINTSTWETKFTDTVAEDEETVDITATEAQNLNTWLQGHPGFKNGAIMIKFYQIIKGYLT